MSLPDRLGQADCNAIAILFAALLEDFLMSGILGRAQPGPNGRIPRRVYDLALDNFHQL